MSKAISLHQISMVFQGRGEPVIALEKVDLDLPAGRFGAIIGPSGCGKSTLLRLVADVMQPFAGSISIGGAPPRDARLEYSIGFVFQAPTLLPLRTVPKNIELPLNIVVSSAARRANLSASERIALVRSQCVYYALPSGLSRGTL